MVSLSLQRLYAPSLCRRLMTSLESDASVQYGPVLLRRRARKLEKESGGSVKYITAYDMKRHMSFKDIMKINLTRPFRTSFYENSSMNAILIPNSPHLQTFRVHGDRTYCRRHRRLHIYHLCHSIRPVLCLPHCISGAPRIQCRRRRAGLSRYWDGCIGRDSDGAAPECALLESYGEEPVGTGST